jgi:16S rRNA (cytosine967-C5)-methyltransferase
VTARAAAYRLLQGALRSRRSIDDNFDDAVAGLEMRDRAFVRLLVATTLRRIGQIDDVLKRFVTGPPPPVEDALRIGAAQVLFLDTPAHAAVATTVDLVKRKGQDRLTGLVNAVMRKVVAEGKTIAATQDAAVLNTPAWLMARWTAAHGADAAKAIAASHLVEPPLDLTLKSGQPTPGLAGEMLPTGSWRVANGGRIDELPGFKGGAWWVQDAAAALPARILLHALGSVSGRTVIDLCAAPGGKAAQLANAGCRLTAVDLSKPRTALLKDNLQRLGLDAEIVVADARTWRPAAPADAVLLDAPCSATGTIRRHPDLPYIKRAEDVARFPAIQGALLSAAAAMVKPGGVVVYAVCALEPEEGEGVVDAFLAANAGWQREAVAPEAIGGRTDFITARGDLRTLPSMWPERGGLDGFFAAILRQHGSSPNRV